MDKGVIRLHCFYTMSIELHCECKMNVQRFLWSKEMDCLLGLQFTEAGLRTDQCAGAAHKPCWNQSLHLQNNYSTACFIWPPSSVWLICPTKLVTLGKENKYSTSPLQCTITLSLEGTWNMFIHWYDLASCLWPFKIMQWLHTTLCQRFPDLVVLLQSQMT